ncbi:Vps62-related protein [Bacillus carboniphilus]|uniref:Vps62-related protein n=1 Tax=Bacillus carboniphilus TaxID=86663 RepID=A0ABY9JUQ7_9BACI|nr:Vps62-related protein [Bacillus carboniphilus]WLR42473.1 Vps62-related protein [Bacillus carboniphilus]
MKKTLLVLLSILFLCLYHLPAVSVQAKSFSAEYTDSEKLAIMEQYAPYMWFAKGEQYYPSSVDWAFNHMERYLDSSNHYSLRTKQSINCDSCVIPFFNGDLNTAKVYAYWTDVDYQVADISYMVFYPYNRGKNIDAIEDFRFLLDVSRFSSLPFLTQFGHHVGDWEKIVVRVIDEEIAYAQYDYHAWSNIYEADELEYYEGHPVVYSANGSHGSWKNAGTHIYHTIKAPLDDIPVIDLFDDIPNEVTIATLSDKTSKGRSWKTWNSLVALDKTNKKVLSGLDAWPSWMSSDTTTTLAGYDSSSPYGGGINRWGNEGGSSDLSVLVSGPGGPDDNSDLTGRDLQEYPLPPQVSLKTPIGGYLHAVNGRDVSISPNEATVSLLGNNRGCIKNGEQVAIKTSDGHYFSGKQSGDLTSSPTYPLHEETFTLINQTDANGCLEDGDKVSLKSAYNLYILAAPRPGVHAGGSDISQWTTFQVNIVK